MRTVRHYIWDAVKTVFGIIFGIAGTVFTICLAALLVLLTINYLRWWSLIPFGIILLGYWIYTEARLAYKVDLEMAQEDLQRTYRHIRDFCYITEWRTPEEERTPHLMEAKEYFDRKYKNYCERFGEDEIINVMRAEVNYLIEQWFEEANLKEAT